MGEKNRTTRNNNWWSHLIPSCLQCTASVYASVQKVTN